MASVYQYDIENRFPLNTVTVTAPRGVTVCTVTVTAGGAVAAIGRAATEGDAVLSARRHLGIKDNVLCTLTTTQRDLVASPPTGMEIFNTTTTQIEVYNGSVWQAAS